MAIERKKTKSVRVGRVRIGGNAPISVQSMTTIKTSHISKVVRQIKTLEGCGCDIVRVSVLDEKDARAIKEIQKEIKIPLCADIHFNYQLGVLALQSGADKIRLNPGNVQDKKHIQRVISVAKQKNRAIRIGANSGSLDMRVKADTLGERLAKSLISYVKQFEREKFQSLVLSAKAHSVVDTIEAYRYISNKTDYPLHLGITATGYGQFAKIKSAVGIGSLLAEGIGDTLRVSLTDSVIEEVKLGIEILQSLNLRKKKFEVIACPTCGRTTINVIKLAKKVEEWLLGEKIKAPKNNYKIAVMGCVVNGPGESKTADIGITGGNKNGFIFKKGKMIAKVPETRLFSELIKHIK